MKNILVLFKTVESRQLSDPGAELAKVLDFKRELEASKELLFAQFDTEQDFERAIRRHLLGWMHDRAPKTVKSAPLIPTLDPDTALAAETDEAERLRHAEKLNSDGRPSEAEALFSHAIVTGDPSPTALRSSAQFLSDAAVWTTRQESPFVSWRWARVSATNAQ